MRLLYYTVIRGFPPALRQTTQKWGGGGDWVRRFLIPLNSRWGGGGG